MDNDENLWYNHSHNVTLARKCMSFVDGEYKTNYLYLDRQDQGMEVERGRKAIVLILRYQVRKQKEFICMS